eukprot:945120_1
MSTMEEGYADSQEPGTKNRQNKNAVNSLAPGARGEMQPNAAPSHPGDPGQGNDIQQQQQYGVPPPPQEPPISVSPIVPMLPISPQHQNFDSLPMLPQAPADQEMANHNEDVNDPQPQQQCGVITPQGAEASQEREDDNDDDDDDDVHPIDEDRGAPLSNDTSDYIMRTPEDVKATQTA